MRNVHEKAVAMAKIQKRLMEETPPATSEQERVPPPSPPQFETPPFKQSVVPKELSAEQFLALVQFEPVEQFTLPLAIGQYTNPSPGNPADPVI